MSYVPDRQPPVCRFDDYAAFVRWGNGAACSRPNCPVCFLSDDSADRYIYSPPSLRDVVERLQFETFPVPLVMDSSGEIWFAYPTIHGVSRTTYPKLQKVTPGE